MPFYVRPKIFIEPRIEYQILLDDVDEAVMCSLGIGFIFLYGCKLLRLVRKRKFSNHFIILASG